ncbi:hypothetical protein IAQ61_001337 [Plenodomus lingam]|uniref:Predicted protein n=1 Tax=Leptosphaeria maculans (strain JN3 / isolate v23.1.3 / race Av1-4-5-6-7-8) TaxID=985895 RepID=E4ZXR7_LEPMJ|nr:predicted protein [Plenodomus lingam JN3]KAH9879519.1 hypothetical protein IAQ61_001337 [Plenodomus lingam]CBX96162.1 predicted protein [Plenodomus lingam JN3]
MPPKSGFSRTRNIAYEDDDDDDIYDDYDYDNEGDEEGDAATEHDKEQMRMATIRVREALPDVSDFISDEQVQEALWHYYYDVGKSVTYLKNRIGAGAASETRQEPSKKPKQASRFDQAASAAHQNAPPTTGKLTYALC